MEASMATTVDLFQNINDFLAERKESSPGGGWAPVTQKEIEAMYDIINALIELKYEYDADHDLPVTVRLLDRTMFKSSFYDPMFQDKAFDGYTEADVAKLNLGRAVMNVGIAADEVKLATRLLDMHNTGNGNRK
jgi:hypothetical protein